MNPRLKHDLSAEDCRIEWSNWANNHKSTNGYYKTLKNVDSAFRNKIGVAPTTTDGIQKIMSNESLKRSYLDMMSSELFRNDPEKQELFKDMVENSHRAIMKPSELSNEELNRSMNYSSSMSSEGIIGAGNVYASSKTVFGHTGVLPFVIASYLFTCRSSEIYQLFNGKSTQLDFSYNIDVLQKNGQDFPLPFAYRSGEIMGFNQLPLVKLLNTKQNPSIWKTNPLTDAGEPDYTSQVADALKFSGQKIYCNLFDQYYDGAATDSQGFYVFTNTFEGIDPGSLMIKALIYRSPKNDGTQTSPQYDLTTVNGATTDAELTVEYKAIRTTQYIGKPNERMFNFEVELPVAKSATELTTRKVQVLGIVQLDSGDISFMKSEIAGEDEAEGLKATDLLVGFKLEARLQNISNQMSTATFYTRRQECIREATYRQYASAGINEYMQDNFYIGNDSNTNYQAYAIDHILEATNANRELESEEMLMEKINNTNTITAKDPMIYPFAPKVGGFVDTDAEFNISQFTPGISVQEYKVQIREYIMERLSFSDTYLNINQDLPHEWILLCNNLLANKLVVTKYESQTVSVGDGGATNPFGAAIDTRAGFVDNLDRRVRVIANTDIRWFSGSRKDNILGAIKTHTMNMPFFVYYPYNVRMFQTIDANFPNRSAIVVSGMDLRDCWTAGLFKMRVEGAVSETTQAVNVFSNQMNNSMVRVSNTEVQPVWTKQAP